MASEVTKRLRDRRMQVWEQCKALADNAAQENRAFNAEEQGSWEVMNEELDTLDKRIKSALDAEKRAKEADDAFNAVTRRPETRGGNAGYADSDGRDVNAEIRSFLKGERGAPRSLEITRNPDLGPVNYRTLTTTASGSSAIVPTDFYDQLIAHLIEVSGVMQAGPTVLNTAGGEILQVPKTTQHSTAASAAQAGALPSSSDPVFGMQTLSSYKYGIMVPVARELLDDSGVDLLGYLAMQCGRAVGNAFGADLVTGTGSSQPYGITNAVTGVTGVTAASGMPTYNNLVDLEYSVIAPYRQSRSCYWLAADKTIGSFRKIVDAQSRPIWEPSAVLGSPDLLLGKPLVADPFMPLYTTTGNKAVAFGDFSQYFVRLIGGVRFERSDDFGFGSDLTYFRCILRGDGTLVDRTGAIKTLAST